MLDEIVKIQQQAISDINEKFYSMKDDMSNMKEDMSKIKNSQDTMNQELLLITKKIDKMGVKGFLRNKSFYKGTLWAISIFLLCELGRYLIKLEPTDMSNIIVRLLYKG